jgi:acyl carrier protein
MAYASAARLRARPTLHGTVTVTETGGKIRLVERVHDESRRTRGGHMSSAETALVLALVGTAIAAMVRLRPARADGSPLESRVCRVLARELGVPVQRLALDVVLDRDLGRPPAAVVSIAAALEAEFGIIIPERRLRAVRTCRHLLNATLAQAAECVDDRPLVSARVVPPAAGTDVHYTGVLTPDTARSLAEQAFRAGPGTRLDVHVLEDADDLDLGWVAEQFAWLHARGVRVGVAAAG